MMMQMELDKLNEQMCAAAEEWRRTELPKARERIFAAGIATLEQIKDHIVTREELEALGWECDTFSIVWREKGFGTCH